MIRENPASRGTETASEVSKDSSRRTPQDHVTRAFTPLRRRWKESAPGTARRIQGGKAAAEFARDVSTYTLELRSSPTESRKYPPSSPNSLSVRIDPDADTGGSPAPLCVHSSGVVRVARGERTRRRPTDWGMLPTAKRWRFEPNSDNARTASDRAVVHLPLISLPAELLGHISGHLGPAGLLGMARADRTMRAACALSIHRLLRGGSALSLGGFTPIQRLVLLAHAEATADRALEAEGTSELSDELHAIAQSGRCRYARTSGWRSSSWVGRLVQRLWPPSWLAVHAELIAALVLARWCELAEEQGDPHILASVLVRLAVAWKAVRRKATSSSSWMCIAALALKHDHVSAETVCIGMHAIAVDVRDATDSRRQSAVEAGAIEAVVAAMRTFSQVVAVQAVAF